MPSRFAGVQPGGQRLSRVFRDREQARPVLEPWRRWYKTARWQRLRLGVLERDCYTCGKCQVVETDTSQLVADHRVPHRGDEALFWAEGNLWCLCAACHNRVKQAEERAAR